MIDCSVPNGSNTDDYVYGRNDCVGITAIETYKSPQINHVILFLSLSNKDIYRIIPNKLGTRVRAVLKILIMVNGYPRCTEGYLGDLMDMGSEVVRKSMLRLVELGMIKKVGKPRYVVPFGKYIVDRSYVITPVGIKALKELI